MTKPKTDFDALVLALELALSAPTQEKADKATEIADAIASKLPPEQVEGCKAIALANFIANKA